MRQHRLRAAAELRKQAVEPTRLKNGLVRVGESTESQRAALFLQPPLQAYELRDDAAGDPF
jgi:hypothetical protein